MTDEQQRGECVYCSKQDVGTPPTYGEPMCQECWATRTEEGRQWVEEYYSREAWHEEQMRGIDESEEQS